MQHNSPALVAVYCGSRLGNQPSYIDSAKQLGDRMAEAGLAAKTAGVAVDTGTASAVCTAEAAGSDNGFVGSAAG